MGIFDALPVRHIPQYICLFLALVTYGDSFTTQLSQVNTRHPKEIFAHLRHPDHTALFASSNDDQQQRIARSGFAPSSSSSKNSKKSGTGVKQNLAAFEMQELRAQLDEMAKRNLSSSNLSMEKRLELEGYVKNVCEKSPSPIPLETLALPPNVDLLKGMWRLGFSTEKAALNVLPKEARVFVNILTTPNLETGQEGKLDYVLRFSMGALREITAKSTYSVDVSKISSVMCFSANFSLDLTFCLNPTPLVFLSSFSPQRYSILAWTTKSRFSDLYLQRNHLGYFWFNCTCRIIRVIKWACKLHRNYIF